LHTRDIEKEKLLEEKRGSREEEKNRKRQAKLDSLRSVLKEEVSKKEKYHKEKHARVEKENKSREIILANEAKQRGIKTEDMIVEDIKQTLPFPDELELNEPTIIQNKQPGFLKKLFSSKPISIEVTLENKIKKSNLNDGPEIENASILEIKDNKQPLSLRKGKIIEKSNTKDKESKSIGVHDQDNLLTNLREKEEKSIKEEIEQLRDYIYITKLPKKMQDTIKFEEEQIQKERKNIIDEVYGKKEKIILNEKQSHKEIKSAIQTIKHDKLIYKPKELVLEKERLIGKLSTNVEQILDMVSHAREAMMRLDVNKTKAIYSNIMAIYLDLDASSKREVYGEINDLYLERKKLEKLFL